MAAIISREYFFKVMEEKQLPYFEVTDGRDLIDINMEETNIQRCMDMLNEIFDQVEESIVHVKLSEKTKKEKAEGGVKRYLHFEYKVRLKASAAPQAGIGSNNTMIGFLKEIQDLNIKILEIKKDQEMTELRREMAEMKKEKKPDAMEKMAMDALSKLMNGEQTGASAGIAGTGDGKVNTDKANSIKRVKDALTRLAKIDSDLPDTLETIAAYAEKFPSKYQAFKPMLKAEIE